MNKALSNSVIDMIGLIFNTLEKVVIEELGEDTWDDLLDESGSDGVYHGLGNYDDAEIVSFVKLAAEKLQKDPADILRWFGENAAAEFSTKFPDLFARFDNIFEFVLSLNDIIHPHVKQLYPAAQVPHFNLIKQDETTLVIEYVSARQMCHLAEGLIKGSAKLFETQVEVAQPQCVHSGDKHCHLQITLLT